MKVLITSPSLNEQDNVSGISTMISNIIEGPGPDYVHFTAGRKDNGKFDLDWLITQAKLPFEFRKAVADADPDVVHINTAFEPRAIVRDLVLAKSAGKRPILLHVHGGRFVMQDYPNKVLALLADQLLRSAARVVTLSEVEAESILKRSPGVRVAVLPNAVPATRFAATDRAWGEKTIVYLGRMDEAKGLNDMVESCRMLVTQGFKFRFDCYGSGPDQESFVRAMTGVLGDKFRFGGVVAGSEKVAALHRADIFLMPSKFEGLPLSLLEAMAAGCVPAVSDRGAIPSVIDDGRNGFLVEPGDLTQIVGKLKFLLSEGEPGWNDLRENARRTIVDGFDFPQYSKRLQDLYAEIGHAQQVFSRPEKND
jgi:glycosyltransferase involved in cell wall biosynthesis